MTIVLRSVTPPSPPLLGDQPEIPSEIFDARANSAYTRAGADWLVVYADREHFGNIAFLTGFEPRFEEAFLLLGPHGKRVLIVGNECGSYVPLARLENLTVLRSQTLSLMAQDRSLFPRFSDRVRDAGVKTGDSIALVGWKYLERDEDDDPSTAFFVPAVYVRMVQQVVGPSGVLRDATPILMHPATGARSVLDVHQIAAFEWAATRCSQALWQIVANVREGDSEFDAVARMRYAGEPFNVHTMFASASAGEPVIGLRSPTGRRLRRGDGVTTALGLWGALSSRAGMLDTENDGFLEHAKTYFSGLISWYENAGIGVAGGDLYAAVTETLARGGLKSALNPGHLTGHEEWSHSPVRPRSNDKLSSGMPFQIDVIPTPLPIGQALNCEDPVTLADEALRNELRAKYPDAAARIEARRTFMRDKLGVAVKPEILPLSATPLCLPPFWLRPGDLLARA